MSSNIHNTKGSSPYEGWGTALKPAMELWTLARKPLSEKTIAQNVLKHGTGGINIDGCRVGTGGGTHCNNRDENGKCLGHKDNNGKFSETIHADISKVDGRFPANLIHDGSDEIVGLFPDTTKGGKPKTGTQGWNDKYVNGEKVDRGIDSSFYDAGGGSAARFFYCAKASKAERNKGLEGFDEKFTPASEFRPNHMEKTLEGKSGNPYGRWTPVKNNHPTVKPIKLMQYLCRLITPKDGIVLDPFMGSGTTGIACKLEGFDFIGIERDSEYMKIAEARIKATTYNAELF